MKDEKSQKRFRSWNTLYLVEIIFLVSCIIAMYFFMIYFR